MKKLFIYFLVVFLIFSSTATEVFASVKLDGTISAVEIENSNIQNFCSNGNSGCNLYEFVTCCKIFPDSDEIYLAFNAELKGEQNIVSENFGFEIYIEDYPVIKIYADNRVDFDPLYYDIKVNSKTDLSRISCETSVLFKNKIPTAPKIYVKVVDNDGIPSKMFEINTVVHEDNTVSHEDAHSFSRKNIKSDSKPTNTSDSQSTDKANSDNKKNNTLQHGTSENTLPSSKTHENLDSNKQTTLTNDSLLQYNLSSQISNKGISVFSGKSNLLLIAAIIILILLAGAAAVGIKIKRK